MNNEKIMIMCEANISEDECNDVRVSLKLMLNSQWYPILTTYVNIIG